MTTGSFGSVEVVLPPVGIDLAKYKAPNGSLQDYHKRWFLAEERVFSRLSNPTLREDKVAIKVASFWLESLLEELRIKGIMARWLPGQPCEVYFDRAMTEMEKTILRNSIDNFSVDDMFPSV